MSDRFECEIRDAGAGSPCVVAIRGEVDLASAADLEVCLRRALEGAPSSIVLDLEALTFIDSSGLRVLVSIANDTQTAGATFGLKNVPRHAQRVFEITGLSEWFAGNGGA